MEYSKADLNWLMNKTEKCSERYMEAETILLAIMRDPWYKRIFLRKKIAKFLMSRGAKYKF
jgi:hypothetical protein